MFDIDADPEERVDLAGSEPVLTSALLARFRNLARAAYAPNGEVGARASLACGDDACWDRAAALADDDPPACAKMRETGFYQPWVGV